MSGSPFAPLGVRDIEATAPIEIGDLRDHGGVHALVRAAGTPVGTITIHSGRAPTVADIEAEIHRRLGKRIARQLGREQAVRVRGEEAGPTVSVVVCTHDRPDDLARCLDGLDDLAAPPHEILVIDSATRDRRVAEVVARHPGVRYVREDHPGLDVARNRGIAESTGEVIAFTDDDVVVDREWALALAAVFAHNPEAAIVTGLVMPLELETEAQWFFEQYGGFARGFDRRWHLVDQDRAERAAPRHGNPGIFGTGANMAFRRCVFDRVGLFDPALDMGTPTRGGGDLDMFFRTLKAGMVLVYEPRAIIWHRHRRTLEELYEQLYGWGSGMYSFVTSSWRQFPDERAAIARKVAWLSGAWFLRRYASSFVRPRFPRALIHAEMRGALNASRHYDESLRLASLRHGDGVGRPAPPVRSDRVRRRRTVSRIIRADEDIAPLGDVTDASRVTVDAVAGDRSIAVIHLSNQWRPVGSMRLADALAARLVP